MCGATKKLAQILHHQNVQSFFEFCLRNLTQSLIFHVDFIFAIIFEIWNHRKHEIVGVSFFHGGSEKVWDSDKLVGFHYTGIKFQKFKKKTPEISISGSKIISALKSCLKEQFFNRNLVKGKS